MKAAIAAMALMLATPGAASAQDVARGEETYLLHCATCHGLEATGQGPMSPVLMIRPTDLTRLSATNDGIFPLFRVIQRIDGRDPLVSHGSPMPVFGNFFEGEDATLKTDEGQPILTSAPVVDLVAYIRTLQVD